MGGAGIVIAEDGGDVLRRTGRMGVITRFQRFQLPSPESEHRFRGDWLLIGTNAAPRGRWMQRIVINGSVWIGNAPGRRGFLKGRQDGGVTLCGSILSLVDDGNLRLTSPSGKVLEYRRFELVVLAWQMDPGQHRPSYTDSQDH